MWVRRRRSRLNRFLFEVTEYCKGEQELENLKSEALHPEGRSRLLEFGFQGPGVYLEVHGYLLLQFYF